ncbi:MULTISPECIES: peptide chain release factor N(5)-glutamine methyltransferase [Symbiopectobacterium]|uniref:peptide chain release factor N(5)-glutamine methyltransferase n=1 Tax=Symbiopectobacterium TaxID=801 RepID=UPI001A33748F|nr:MULTISPECIES: peptide chain release factor N(5)-glutamine methyltransferase [Symbiopectobacterium]MBG6247984.1 peptide chain release factor N(5)-glutamine methyltransferase [Candidatus Symbiopectobacterium sp. PLON1]MBT9428577.1 peptide chain release factor N(5)-glutamine methyltransferase [Candidatus Symbiopectobacterium endolongispinus]
MDYRTWVATALQQLTRNESPKRDAEILLEHVTGKGRTFLLAFGETLLDDAQLQRLSALLARRINGEPVAYLTGAREFWSLPLAVSPATLIPRPDTECLVEQALQCMAQFSAPTVLDLGTGTGAIALALASERPDCTVTGVDVQPDAVTLAQRNAATLQLSNVQFLHGNWFEPVAPTRFSVIVSNPPYIDAEDIHLREGDVRFEPLSALVAAEGGLADLRWIIQQAPQHLKNAGWLLLEHGWQQGEPVRQLLQQRGFEQVATCRDYGGNERVTLGQWPAAEGGA